MMWIWFVVAAAAAVLSGVESAGAGAARLVCYVESARATDGFSECTHLVYAGDARGDKLDTLLKDYKKNNPRLKIILRVSEVDKDLRSLLKSKHVQGLEISDAHKSLNKTKVLETVEAARSAITSSGGGPLFLALPAHPELLAKYYDLRSLMKKVDLLMVQTHALGVVEKMTYHPSRLSGMWDMMNTDSVVDLVIGLGVPSSKVVISLPATANQFTLVNETLSTPGSPTTEDEPKEIDQAELCRQLRNGRWTLERDQDLSAPYAFKNKTWISFEDSSSIDVKGKYARVRGLAGLALQRADRDVETPCGPTLRASLAKVLNQQSRAPRAAVLRSLENEILSAPGHARALDALQVSPYRITQVVDSDGVIHSIREDTRTEFSCSRQGYFVHPRSCARFYRCVKFDQLSPEYTVFEFDCPAGLAFDSRYEVCVWPGSLPESQACPGSSEIAPVPKTRFICPEHEGYYADPENCRWFFACLDHGKSPLTAYEFRCPFGLGFDAERLKCDWPWLVPACGNIARYEAEAHGFSAATLTGAAGYQGQTADAINVAAHQSLVSGASLNNLVGIQGGFLTKDDALDSNFIASQELANAGHSYEIGHGSAQGHGLIGHGIGSIDNSLVYNAGDAGSVHGNIGLVQPTQYNGPKKYSSGSIILDDYRLPTQEESLRHGAHQSSSGYPGQAEGYTAQTGGYTAQNEGYTAQNGGHTAQTGGQSTAYTAQNGGHSTGYTVQAGNQATGYNGYSGSYTAGQGQKTVQYQSSNYDDDNSGAYVHDPTGDSAEPYKHVGSPVVPYVHDGSYKHTPDYYDVGRYSGSSENGYDGKYSQDQSGQYVHDNAGSYVETGAGSTGYNGDYSSGYSTGYNADYSGAYKHDDSGKYKAGVYRADGHIGEGKSTYSDSQQYHGYSAANAGNYISDSKAYTGSSHTLTAGAINVGLVGKTTLIDADYNDQGHYQSQSGAYNHNQGNYQGAKSYSHSTQTLHPAHVSYVSQPAVSINHIGTDGNNLDGYSFVTTPTSSGIPTTATPFAATTSLPTVTYKTTYVPEVPKTSVKQIFGVSQPAVTYVQPTAIAVHHVTPQIQITDHNQGVNYQYESRDYSASQNGQAKSESGYQYSKPTIKFEDGVSYTTAAPAVSVSTYEQGSNNNQETLHQDGFVGYDYSTRTPVHEEPFKKVVAYTTGPSVTTYAPPTVSTYTPHSFSHQTIHKVESSNSYTPSVETASVGTGYEYPKSTVAFEEPKTVQYTTPQPALAYQPVVSTYQPQVISHQTLHKVDANRVNTYSGGVSSGYNYEKPAVQFQEVKTVYSIPAQIVSSTYKPQSYSHQTIHKVESQNYVPVSSTPKYEVSYQSTPVTVYQNPILQYTQKATPATYVQPTYKSQSFSHQTIHKSENRNAYNQVNAKSGYEYTKPAVAVTQEVHYSTAQPAVVSTYQPQVYSQQTLHNVDTSQVNTYTQDSGYEYNKPAVKFEEAPKTVFQYSTPAPIVSSTYKPQSYSHQTIHKVESQNYVPVSSTPKYEVSYQSTPVTVYQNPTLQYTQKATPATYVQPTYKSQSFSHQTIHKSENRNAYNQVNAESGYEYTKPAVAVTQEVHYSTAQPAVVSTYQPQVYSQQTLHNVDTSQVNTYTQDSGYEYNKPAVKFEEAPKTVFQYSTPSPIVSSTYRPQTYSHQTIHNVEPQNYVPGSSTLAPKVELSYQQGVTLHNVDTSQVNTYTQDSGYEYNKPAVKFEEAPKTVFQYSTPSPIVSSTYRPQTYSHQTIHNVEPQNYVPGSSTLAPKVELSYQQGVSTYENPILKYTQKVTPVTYVQPTAAVYTQTNKPVIQQHEVKHIVSQPVQYEQHVQFNQEGYSYSQPEIQRNIESKGYSDATLVSHQVYHQSNGAVKSDYNAGKDIVFVSTSPSTLIYEDHYADYESPKVQTYKASEYVPPKNEYKSYSVASTASAPVVHQSSVVHKAQQYVAPKNEYKSYSVSSTAAPVVHESSVVHHAQEYIAPQAEYQSYSVSTGSTPIVQQSTVLHQAHDNYDYSQQYETVQKSVPSVQQHSFSTTHIEQPQKVESIHFSFPSSTASPTYQQVEYRAPEIQVAYKGEEYIPPVASTATPIVTSTYRPRTYSTVSTTREYLPPAEPKYEYLPPSTTARPIVKSTTPAYRAESTTAYQASEYLPPDSEAKLVNFESFGFNDANAASKIKYNPYQEFTTTHDTVAVQRKQNIVVETAKSHLLGFGTVGPDAGLVSPVTYTTAAPVVSSTYRQRVKSTARPAYKYSTTTEYQAPEYLPPADDLQSEVNFEGLGYNRQSSGAEIKYTPYQEVTVSTSAPIQRKQNIVIQTAKSQNSRLGFGTVGQDAGLVTYTTSAPVVSSSESYSYSPQRVTSTYAPVEQQGLFEVNPPPAPVRRTKPKVAVVTKINDFNPFLVRKLGAVCSCQSPVLVLKGRRPTQAPQDLGDYNDYDYNRGDINAGEYGHRTVEASDVKTVATAAPIVTSTFNPIIVPEDSFYQDYQEQGGYDVAVTPKHKEVYSESYVSSTPIIASTTERIVRVRPRVKAVTAAPTYKTVLLNQEVAPTVTIKDESGSSIDSQAFDRYGPGGWRSRDETLQGSVDCQRAGLFRHPKQCNKFYACRWDCTKQRFTLHVFNCPVQLSFDPSIGACNWPSQGPACQGDTLLTNVL